MAKKKWQNTIAEVHSTVTIAEPLELWLAMMPKGE